MTGWSRAMGTSSPQKLRVRIRPSATFSTPSLLAIVAHSTRSAFDSRLVHLDDFSQLPASRTDFAGDVEDPSPQLPHVLDQMPRAVPEDNEPMRRADAGFVLDQN
jgi:hypothetical protein